MSWSITEPGPPSLYVLQCCPECSMFANQRAYLMNGSYSSGLQFARLKQRHLNVTTASGSYHCTVFRASWSWTTNTNLHIQSLYEPYHILCGFCSMPRCARWHTDKSEGSAPPLQKAYYPCLSNLRRLLPALADHQPQL
jgi:hypothetical protein